MNQNVASETIDTNYVRLQCLYLSLLRVMKNVGVAWSVSSCRILNLKKIWCVLWLNFCSEPISLSDSPVWHFAVSAPLHCCSVYMEIAVGSTFVTELGHCIITSN